MQWQSISGRQELSRKVVLNSDDCAMFYCMSPSSQQYIVHNCINYSYSCINYSFSDSSVQKPISIFLMNRTTQLKSRFCSVTLTTNLAFHAHTLSSCHMLRVCHLIKKTLTALLWFEALQILMHISQYSYCSKYAGHNRVYCCRTLQDNVFPSWSRVRASTVYLFLALLLD